jgi:hypothetical protein
VEVVPTATGVHEAKDPAEIEIIRMPPARSFEKLATVKAHRFRVDKADEMYRALRSKSAPLGADAVVIVDEGVMYAGHGYPERWVTGIAIRYR